MKSEEQYFFPFSAAPVANLKYGFGSNNTIQTRRTKKLVIYPFAGTPIYDMVPFQQFTQNQLQFNVASVFFNCVLISIASRDGGYYCLDLPLTRFIKTNQIHDNLTVDWKVDFNNSYVRFTFAIPQPVPFVIYFSFRLHDEN